MPPVFALPTEAAIPVHIIEQDGCADWLEQQSQQVVDWAQANGFTAACGQALMVPGADGKPAMALVGYGTSAHRARRRFVLAGATEKLPKGTYSLASRLDQQALETECLGWLLGGYRFDRYRN